MTAHAADYRNSHLSGGKPAGYDAQFADPRNVKTLYWQLERQILDTVLPTNEVSGRQTILDFACGTGRLIGYLRPRFENAIGIDVSEAMLNEARKHVDAEFITGDATCQEIRPAVKPDVITAFRFFLNAQHELQSNVLQWMHTWLADDGRLICNFHLNPHSLIGVKMRTLKWLRRWETTPMMSVRQAKVLLRSHGFSVKQVIGYGYLYYGQYRIWAPASILLPAEQLLMRCGLFSGCARNFIVVAEKA